MLPDPEFHLSEPVIAVERVIAELRAARDIILYEGPDFIRVTSVESLRGTAERLILSAARLRWLGLEVMQGAALDVTGQSEAQILALVCGRARIAVPALSPASPLELAALELAKLALVLPAIIVSEHNDPNLLRAPASAIAEYSAQRVAALKLVTRAPVPLEGAQHTEFVVFRGGEGLRDQVAVLIGKPDFTKPVTVRLHSACLTGDLFGSLKCDCGDQLRHTAKFMAENGGGVLLYLDQEGRANGLSNKIRAYALQAKGYDTYDADEVLGFDHDQRHFDFAAEMLKQLGVGQVRVMTNNPVKIAALEAAGLEVVADQRIVGRKNDHNVRYLASKRDRAGHMLEE